MGEEWISASDIEKYGYCPLSWWLHEKEEEIVSEKLKKGKEKHEEFSKELDDVKKKEEESGYIENLVLWLAVASTVVSIMGLTFFRSDQFLSEIIIVNALIWVLAATFFLFSSETGIFKGEELRIERIILIFAIGSTILAVYSLTLSISDFQFARLAQIISLFWLAGATYWLKRSIVLRNEAEDKRRELSVEQGDVEYVDREKEKSRMLESEEFRLRGRPDYILKVEDDTVPVEVKTGRVPKGPFFSHVLQIAAYCFLVEQDTGNSPPYGVVKYGDEEFEVEFDESLKDLLLEKLDDMREALEEEDVHRNHSREGKCKNCSRRDICPESLV